MSVKKIAVIILNWNGAHFLKRYLPNILQNSDLNTAEIIVADNGSTDNSIEILQQEFKNVTIIRLEKNYGFAEGYNQAINQLDNEFVLLLNSDVEVSKNWLEPLIKRIEENTKIAACVPKIKSINEPSKFEYAGAAGGFIDRFGYAFCRGRIFDTVEEDKGQYDDACRVFWGTGAALLVRTTLYKQAKGLDRKFFAHMEEIDLCWRFNRMGFEIWYEPQSTVYHLGGGTLAQGNPHKTFLNYRNSLMMLLKNLKKRELIWILPFRMILDGISALKCLADKNTSDFGAIFRAHMAFYENITYTISERKQIKTTKFISNKLIYKGSIVWLYFAKHIKTYSSIKN